MPLAPVMATTILIGRAIQTIPDACVHDADWVIAAQARWSIPSHVEKTGVCGQTPSIQIPPAAVQIA
jgi:hypothetical protein